MPNPETPQNSQLQPEHRTTEMLPDRFLHQIAMVGRMLRQEFSSSSTN